MGENVSQHKSEIIHRLEDLLQPLLEARGLELVELGYQRPQRGRGTLRLFVDRTGGVTLEDLTRMNRLVGEVLEVHDLIPGPYNLEVSSPCLTRPLKTERDYQRYVGRLVRVTTRTLIYGRQVHQGLLKAVAQDEISLEVAGTEYPIPFGEIARARLTFDLTKKT